MSNIDQAKTDINDFLSNEKQKYCLLKGTDDSSKIIAAYSCLKHSDMRKGILRTSKNVRDIPGLLKSMGVEGVKNNYKFNTIYKIENMLIKFDSYTERWTIDNCANGADFALIYPVQEIANSTKKQEWFIEMLKELKCKKVILVTTNDANYDFSWLTGVMDVVQCYDLDNKELNC